MSIRICKCKYKNEKMYIEYQKKNAKNGWDDFTLSCEDAPRPEYERTIDKIKPFVSQFCEIPGELNSRINVGSVKFSWGGEPAVMGVVISATMQLKKSNGVLQLNTPHKTADHYSQAGGDDDLLLPDQCIDLLETLQEECKLYIKGERAQGDMFKGKEKKS